MDKLFCCTACGVQGETKCACGKGYTFMPAAEAMALRKREAERLYKGGMTMERIGEALGVSKMQISRDLSNCNEMLQSKPVKTVSNPKGAGRPKDGSIKRATMPEQKQARRKPGETQAQRSINTTPEEWERFKNKALEEGYPSAAAKLGELIVEPEIDRTKLSATAQEKLDAAIRQHQRKLDLAFEQRVVDDIKRRVEKLVLPSFKEEREDHDLYMRTRKGVFTQLEYNVILRCVHPDRTATIDEKNEAFRMLHERRLVLLSNKDDPRKYPNLPTVDEFMA